MPASLSDVSAPDDRLVASQLIVVGESILVGLLSGVVVTAFRLVLGHAEDLRHAVYSALRFASPGTLAAWAALLAAVGLLLGWMDVRRPMIKGSGIPQLKGALQGSLRMDWVRELPLKIGGGILAIGFGLSLGREGPSVQIGSYVGRAMLGPYCRSSFPFRSGCTCSR